MVKSTSINKNLSVLIGVITAILLGMVLLISQGYDPIESYGRIIHYSLMTVKGRANTLTRIVFLIIAGCSASIGLGSGASNLGQFGQILLGAFTANIVGLYLPLPAFILLPLMVVVGCAAGALYSGLAALGKKYFQMNEFITTLMLNFIADYFIRLLISGPFKDPNTQWPASCVVPDNVILPQIGLYDTSIFILLIVYAAIVFYMKKSRTGFEFKMMGVNPFFAKAGGCSNEKNFMKAMLLSGAFAGLLGVFFIIGSGQQHRVIVGLGQSYADDGLMISIVANNNIAGVFIYAALFSILQSGATGMQLDVGVPAEFTEMLIAITVLSVVAFRSCFSIVVDKILALIKARELKKELSYESNN